MDMVAAMLAGIRQLPAQAVVFAVSLTLRALQLRAAVANHHHVRQACIAVGKLLLKLVDRSHVGLLCRTIGGIDTYINLTIAKGNNKQNKMFAILFHLNSVSWEAL